MALNTQPNLARPDDFYEALIDMHRDLDDAQSQSANAQLILLLANHIGEHATCSKRCGMLARECPTSQCEAVKRLR